MEKQYCANANVAKDRKKNRKETTRKVESGFSYPEKALHGKVRRGVLDYGLPIVAVKSLVFKQQRHVGNVRLLCQGACMLAGQCLSSVSTGAQVSVLARGDPMETDTKCKQSNYMTPNTPKRMGWNNVVVVHRSFHRASLSSKYRARPK